MKHVLSTFAAALFLAAASPAIASETLAREQGCLACHHPTEKRAGPSIKDIAAKHKGKAGAADTLAASIKAGKGHPPSAASEADLKAILGWMLK